MTDKENKMADTGGGLDDLFREGLGNQQMEPSAGVWKGISRRLLRTELVHFNFTNVPKGFWIGAAALVVVGAFFLFYPFSSESPLVKNPAPSVSGEIPKLSPNTLPVTTSSTLTSRQQNIPASKEEKSSRTTPRSPSGQRSGFPVLSTSPKNSTKTRPVDYALNVPKPAIPVPAADQGTILYSPAKTKGAPLYAAGDEFEFTYMTNGFMPDLYELPPADTVLRFVTTQGITNVPVLKKEVPQFFSGNLGVSPEMAFYRNATQYSEANCWINAGITYHVGKFSVQTGAGVGYVYDHNSYRVNYKSKDSIGYFTSIVSFTITPGNVIVFKTKDVTVYDSIQHFADSRTVSRYTYLRIPVLLGYELFSTNRFSLGIKAGPSVSFLIASKEAQPFIDYPNATLIRVDDNSLQRIKINWEFQAALDLDFRISKQFSVYAQPYYKHYFNPFAEQESEPVKDPYSLGIEVGARINFGAKGVKPSTTTGAH